MKKIENYQLHIENFKILSNGADGGHRYIVTEMQYKGSLKRVSVFLNDKTDENRLVENAPVTVVGQFTDDGNTDLLISRAKII
ncbi:hypothetical protein [Flavobacterium subsaxonicum]|nr:hypothetical protein [Flavobacterium subsaxonicum]